MPRRIPATQGRRLLLGLAFWLPALALGLLVAAHLIFFAVRSAHLLAYPFPIDYGEGPLLAQVVAIRSGSWQLYRDPGQAPFLVVNYPPVYQFAAGIVALATSGAGDLPRGVLLAGRLVSLGAGLLSALAIYWLALPPRRQPAEGRGAQLPALLVALAFLGIPIVREWSSVMRVDMLGVCLGLWGLVLVQRLAHTRGVLWAAPLLALALLTKPSLLAAPAAAFTWLLFRNWRGALGLATLTGLLGASAAAALQIASGGWFWLHVVDANANPWNADLAYGFWRDQIVLLQPLMLASGLAVAGWILRESREPRATEPRNHTAVEPHSHELRTSQQASVQPSTADTPSSIVRSAALLPLYYSLFGLLTAVGVGKFGAYTNYFLEAYAGLFALAACGAALGQARSERRVPAGWLAGANSAVALLAPSLIMLLAALTLTRYYPVWSEEYLLPAGIVEGRNPVRVSFGAYGVWQDLRREEVVLAARGRINEALNEIVGQAGAPIYTDVPGVAAQAGQVARLQIFEHRMLIDAGLYDQRPLLRDLAGGRVPLVVLDYLGNWMTPEQIAIITRRYAQDLSAGTYTIYRPVDPGPSRPIDLSFPNGLRATSIALTAPGDGQAYGLGEAPVITLAWQRDGAWAGEPPEVVLVLTDQEGRPLLETSRPLLYGALGPDGWPTGAQVQHMQPLALPLELPPGAYQLALALRSGGQNLSPPQQVANLTVAAGGGRVLGEQGYFVPAPMLGEWERLGGYAGPGDPVTPAVPFSGFTQQCYKTICLRLQGGAIERLPVGERAWLADAGLPRIAGAPPDGQLGGAFQQLYDELGGEAQLGPVLGGEMKRFGDIVQYTRFGRLERPLEGGPARLGNAGEDVLRLPGGTPYRWP